MKGSRESGAAVKPTRDPERELLHSFAEKYHLHVKPDECGDPVILGSRGHLYAYSPEELGLMIFPPDGTPSVRLWNLVLSKCLAVGMTLRQCGDAEGAFSFDPGNKQQSRLAIKVTRVRPKKQISEEHKRKLLAGLEKSRSRNKLILEGVL